MSNIPTTNNEEEDDWETAEITIPTKGKLRPTAPTFQPKPSQGQASGSRPAVQAQGQRVHAPPGGLWNGNVDKRAQRSDWEARKLVNQGGEEGDDWFGEGRAQSNRQLWDEANSNKPPPQITFAQTQQLPTPQIKILRRQAPSNSTSENVVQTIQGKTYAEKEEEYRLARERIFGGASPASGEGGGSGSKAGSPIVTPTGRTPPISRNRTPDSARGISGNGVNATGGINISGVVRQPRGPGDGGGFTGGVGDGGMMNAQVQNQSSNGKGSFPPGW